MREGFYGKKDTFGIPYFYDTSTIFNNEYANKSEKNRHEILLNEFSKLKTYLDRHPDKQLYLIKDFLTKFHIDEIEKYSKKQLLYLCSFISNADNTIFSRCLKPYLNIKNMIYDILNNPLELSNLYLKDENDFKDNNLNDYNNPTVIDINDKKENYLEQNNLKNNIYKKINSPERNLKKTEKYYLSPLINRKKANYLTQSVKIRRPLKFKNKISFNEIKTYDNDEEFNDNKINKKKSVILDLNSTNSNLKYMKYQKKTFVPYKSYSNNNTIIDEIGKEIRDIENDYNEKLKELELMKNSENKNNNLIGRRRNSINIANLDSSDKLYVNINNYNNPRLKAFVPIHYSLTKNYNGKMKNFNDILKNNNDILNSENNVYRKRLLSLDNCCLNSTERINKEKKQYRKKESNSKGREGSFEKTKNCTNEIDIIKRLYYIPTTKKFGLQEIKNRLKLTEYIALTNAKKKIYKHIII